jgi:hypothetical protein
LVIIFLNPHNNPKNPENPKNPIKPLKPLGWGFLRTLERTKVYEILTNVSAELNIYTPCWFWLWVWRGWIKITINKLLGVELGLSNRYSLTIISLFHLREEISSTRNHKV